MKIRLFAPWCTKDTEFRNDAFLFSARVSLSEADAILASWEPVDELFHFQGPKAFYCAEPFEVPSTWRHPRWQYCLERLDENDVMRPGHRNPARRIMHDTHHVQLRMRTGGKRLERGIAIVSNNGSAWNETWDEMELRNRMITDRRVDLYGNCEAWAQYRRDWLFRWRTPRNYVGEIAGNWTDDRVLDLSEKYKVAVCLENSCEPNYFTEKFVNAVRAGCIPVYHAHPSVADGILKTAKWVDPADHGFDPAETLEFAISEDLGIYQNINERWLHSDQVAATESSQIRIQIARILEQQLRKS